MVSGIASVVLVLLLPVLRIEGYMDYEDISEQDYGEEYVNYDVVDEDPVTSSGVANNNHGDVINNRIRRDQDEETVNADTLSPEDLVEVKGALKKMLSRIGSENPFTPHPTAPPIDYLPTFTELKASSTTPSYSVPETSSLTEEFIQSSNITEEEKLTSIFKILDGENFFSAQNLPTRSSKPKFMLKNNPDKLSSIKALRDERNSLRNDTTKAAKTPQIDAEKLLEIIAELANEFEANLTRKLNDSILQMSIPTCTTPPAPTTTVQTTVTDEYDANYTGAVIAKCFVCGLDTRGIPQDAHCADAFAGDFLPVVPVDSSAKRKITGFRKYCKYANIRGYRLRRSRPRDIIGRWTGGCAVRWADLSGVYTQRTCRNRLAPATGRHFASKRMAKLERALWNIEDGCIASPVASLTPLSRGVSLYARFHACVCSSSWCNAAAAPQPYYATLSCALGSAVVLGATQSRNMISAVYVGI